MDGRISITHRAAPPPSSSSFSSPPPPSRASSVPRSRFKDGRRLRPRWSRSFSARDLVLRHAHLYALVDDGDGGNEHPRSMSYRHSLSTLLQLSRGVSQESGTFLLLCIIMIVVPGLLPLCACTRIRTSGIIHLPLPIRPIQHLGIGLASRSLAAHHHHHHHYIQSHSIKHELP